MRLRTTALPTFLVTVKPMRASTTGSSTALIGLPFAPGAVGVWPPEA